MGIENLSREELLHFIHVYDYYIKGIVEDLPLHLVDRVPVSVDEFYGNDYELYKEEIR